MRLKIRGRTGVVALVAALVAGRVSAAEPPVPDVRPVGTPEAVFVATRDGCDGNDVPDAPARAFRRADGTVVLFGLHYTNHPLIGPDLDHLKISCRSALVAHGNPDPAAYDDRSWVAATWTADGRRVDALLHHEFQANEHPGRCRYPDYMRCWYNTVLAARSTDGGASFTKTANPVVASAPFPQTVDQGRHRGFFNPSNIASDGRFFYMLASTTGWEGQENGVCLFRTPDPGRPSAWRAYDGTGFGADFTADPNRGAARDRSPSCQPIAPFPAPVGSLVRLRPTGTWLAVFQAKADVGLYPVSGLYAAASRDLLHWSAPRLVLAGATNYDDPCRSGGRVLAYPSLIDPTAPGRNYDTVGTRADLFYASFHVNGCELGADRTLMRVPVTVGTTR